MGGSELSISGSAVPPSAARGNRRGRRAHAVGTTPVAEELRRRRLALDLTVRQAATRAAVTPVMISEIERGVRVPSVATWAKLRQRLGIDAPLAVLTRSQAPTDVLDVHLTRLAACLIGSGGRARLPDLAQALGLPAAAVREQLPLVALRLAACGFDMITDGLEVVLEPLHICTAPLQALGPVLQERRRRVLSEEAVVVLTYIGWHGEATRRDIERFRGEESETLLGRLLDNDLAAAVRDEAQVGHPNRYRLTISGLHALGAASPEELREKLGPGLGALVDQTQAEPLSLDDQVTVLALIAGLDKADAALVARALRCTEREAAVVLEGMAQRGLLSASSRDGGPTYRIGSAGREVLGGDGAEAVRRLAEDRGLTSQRGATFRAP